jgi:prepilin-type N-terminal cleavage/methylation domain-containing protein
MKNTPRRDRGFTLLEMMTVLAIALILMMMMVEVFKVSTHTVQIVERKLAVYEAARGLLDEVEDNVRRTGYNERGELFAIKSMSFTDNDPVTVSNPDPHGQVRALVRALRRPAAFPVHAPGPGEFMAQLRVDRRPNHRAAVCRQPQRAALVRPVDGRPV